MVADLQSFKYLGHQFAKLYSHNLVEWLQCFERAPLKPDQKYVLLTDHLVPNALQIA